MMSFAAPFSDFSYPQEFSEAGCSKFELPQ